MEKQRRMNTNKLNELIQMLRENGITYYKDAQLELHISPIIPSTQLHSTEHEINENLAAIHSAREIDENIEFLHSL